MNSVQDIGSIIGKPVVSLESANKLGQVYDFVVDPLNGEMQGLSIKLSEEIYALVDQREIHSIGPDAIMIDRDSCLLPPDESPIKTLPLAKNQLVGVKVITERGQLMGKVANVLVYLADKPVFIYEVHLSILDKLRGNAIYLPASLASAFSDDRTSLVVADDMEKMDRSLEAVTKRLFGPYEIGAYERATVQVTVRSHSD